MKPWDKDQIKKAAHRSGKPLEVRCAQAFLEAHGAERSPGWEVRLGGYYLDPITGKSRELDVQAIKRKYQKLNDSEVECVLRVMISCKGFPAEEAPVTYSVQRGSIDVTSDPRLPHEIKRITNPGSRLVGPRTFIGSGFGKEGAKFLLNSTKLSLYGRSRESRIVVGFDTYKQEEHKDTYRVKGDSDQYEGLSSALHSALYWESLPKDSDPFRYFSYLYVPILLLGTDWHDIPVDGGTPQDPMEVSWGYVSLDYPRQDASGPMPLLCLLVSGRELRHLVGHLNSLFDQLVQESVNAYRNGKFDDP